jgi:acyl carrier protein
MASTQTEAKVVDIVAEQLGVDKDKITRESNFINDLGADSLDLVEMVMEFESQFGIRIPEDQTDKIQTVGEAIEAIDKAIAA